MPGRTKNQLRCICSRRPLLAYYGREESGEPYLHIRIQKQARMYGEMVVNSGIARIKCRECFRWTKIRLTRGGESISPPTTDEPSALTPIPDSPEWLLTQSDGK